MGVVPPSPAPMPARRIFRWLVAATAADLALLLAVIFIHAEGPYGALVPVASLLAVGLAVLLASTLATGVFYTWKNYPQHRWAIIIVGGITAATLLAHAYVIGLPPAGTPGSVSGQTSTPFQNGALTATPAQSGETLQLTVTAEGNAIANLQLTSDKQISGMGFSPGPTFASPLEPGQSITGTWKISGPANLSLTYQTLTCYSTSSKNYGCIMDEVFYVPEAQGILSGQHCSPTVPNCHMEHPWVSPALIAAGMAIFGAYNAVGWRLFPVLLGTSCIPLMFGTAWRVSGKKRVGYFAAALLALDVMFFSQSSAGLLDIPMVFFGLAAAFVYVAGIRFWKIDQYIISGALLGLAGLSKESALFMAGGLLTYNLLLGGGTRGQRVDSTAKMVLVMAVIFFGGLQTYDSLLASPAVPTFVDHLQYMFKYISSLTADKLACQPTTGYWCKYPNSPGGPPILPTDWLLYYSPVAYYATTVSVCPNVVNGVCQGGSYSYVGLAYYGVTNSVETWTVFFWAPFAAYFILRYFRSANSRLEKFGFEAGPTADVLQGDLKLAGLALIWFLWNYLPYILLFLEGRVTYPFYFLPAMPGLVLGIAFMLTRDWFPPRVALVYLVGVLFLFVLFFPDKAFMPDWLRVIIGR